MEKTIKRPFKYNKLSKINKVILDSLIERTNLFITNIYNFIKIYYITTNSTDDITKDDVYTIFNILKTGDEYKIKNDKYFQFYEKEFKKLYFNPIQQNQLIDRTHLDQIMKNNINIIVSTIKNNITYRFDKYLNRFIRTFMKSKDKNIIEYNNLIKKCSLYEQYIGNEKELIDIYLCALHIEKNASDVYEIRTLNYLIDIIHKDIPKKYQTRSKKNVFNDDFKKIKEYQENFNKEQSLIRKIFLCEVSNDEKNNVSRQYQEIFKLQENILPTCKSYCNELSDNPMKFVKHMIYINNYLQANNVKNFNVFPLGTNNTRHIIFDTASINVAFCKNNYSSIEDKKKEIWQTIFKFPDEYFNIQKKYIFTGTIQTDGVALSLIYLPIKKYDKKVLSNNRKNDGKNKAYIDKKNRENKIREKYILVRNNLLEEIQILNDTIKLYKTGKTKKIRKQELDNLLEELENLPKKEESEIIDANNKYKNDKNNEDKKKKQDEKDKKREKIKENKTKYKELKKDGKDNEIKEINRKVKEFYYIDDLSETEKEELKKNTKILYIDQGKTNLIYVLNEQNDTYMRYTGNERRNCLQTKMHTRRINRLLRRYKINDKNINKLNKKSTNLQEMKENMKLINDNIKRVYDKTKRKKLRQEKLLMYIDKQRSESYVINKLVYILKIGSVEKLKEYTIIIGDWKGNNNLKNNKSSMGIGMKRMLKKYVKNMYLIDEYNTSQISNENYKMFQQDMNKKDINNQYWRCKEHTLEIKSILGKKESKTKPKKDINNQRSLRKEQMLELKSKSKKKEPKTILKKEHSILTFQLDNQCIGKLKLKYPNDKETIVTRLIQRDKNAVLNFKTIFRYYLENKKRPLAFQRKASPRSGCKPDIPKLETTYQAEVALKNKKIKSNYGNIASITELKKSVK